MVRTPVCDLNENSIKISQFFNFAILSFTRSSSSTARFQKLQFQSKNIVLKYISMRFTTKDSIDEWMKFLVNLLEFLRITWKAMNFKKSFVMCVGLPVSHKLTKPPPSMPYSHLIWLHPLCANSKSHLSSQCVLSEMKSGYQLIN